MDRLPSPETIREIASVHFLQQQTRERVGELVWPAEDDVWQYRVIWRWHQTTTFLMTLGDTQFALKLSSDKKFVKDTQIELWLREQGQNTPQIFSNWEGQLPGMTGSYFWSIQEYIPGPLWWDSQINSEQLDSFIAQLNALHQVGHKWTTGWGKVRSNHHGESKDFPEHVARFVKKIDECDFFDQGNRRERVKAAIEKMQKGIGDMLAYEPVLIHNDAHPENVILDTEASCRLLDFGNVKWSCPEEEMAVIQTHCIGSRMWVFREILSKYKTQHPFNDELFKFFALLNACSKINTRKNPTKQMFVWTQLVEPLL